MIAKRKWSGTNRRLAKLIAELFRGGLTDNIAAVVIGYSPKKRSVRIFQSDTDCVVIQRFHFIEARKVRCKTGSLGICSTLDRVHHVSGFELTVAAMKNNALA
ncbi:hypothetical protein D9M71_778540 [compost metagenome]